MCGKATLSYLHIHNVYIYIYREREIEREREREREREIERERVSCVYVSCKLFEKHIFIYSLFILIPVLFVCDVYTKPGGCLSVFNYILCIEINCKHIFL